MSRKILIPLSILILSALLASCNFSGSKPTATTDNNGILTQVAGTIVAQRTQQAGQAAIDQLTQIAKTAGSATATPATQGQPTQAGQPTSTPVPPTATVMPTATAVPPTATSVPPTATAVPPTATLVPPTATMPPVAPTAVATPCNWAMFVDDVSVPDGTAFIGGTAFTKTWRLENIGACKWTRDYAFVYQSGDQMGATKVIYLEDPVLPGATLDISVDFTAPSTTGSYAGYWKLRDQNGNLFGTGAYASDALWVKIKVATANEVVYDFTSHMCKAAWSTKDGAVTCTNPAASFWDVSPSYLPVPSSGSGEDVIVDAGSVQRVNNPKLENGHTENESAIVVFPNDGAGGYITGQFPGRSILSGYWFRTVIGCMDGTPQCNVTFKLQYQVGGGAVQTLGTWKQKNDGKIQKVDIDLSFLAGKKVVFIFTVLNNGSNTDDYAFWLYPRIAR